MEDPNDHHFAQDFVAGWFGGVTGLIVGHPLDTVKARLQLDGVPAQYKGTVDCLRQIVKTEGTRALYKGLAAPMFSMAFINAIVFGVQHNIMKVLEYSYLNSCIAGGVAGGVQTFICCPVELIKLRLQAQRNPTDFFHWSMASSQKVYNDPWDAVQKIYGKSGIRGLYKGTVVTLWREIPGFASYFLTYDILCDLSIQLVRAESRDELNPAILCTCGGFSGIAAWTVSYPFDVIKSRLQVDGMFKSEVYTDMFDCARKSYMEGGTTGFGRFLVFFKGLNSTLLRGFVVNAVTFPTVVLILRYWRNDSV